MAIPQGWTHTADALHRTFEFKDFRQAVGFLVRVAFEAEAANHHPEIRNLYKTVTLTLSTHDAGDIVTEKDIDLATAINALV